jgi:hypothetical protein
MKIKERTEAWTPDPNSLRGHSAVVAVQPAARAGVSQPRLAKRANLCDSYSRPSFAIAVF